MPAPPPPAWRGWPPRLSPAGTGACTRAAEHIGRKASSCVGSGAAAKVAGAAAQRALPPPQSGLAGPTHMPRPTPAAAGRSRGCAVPGPESPRPAAHPGGGGRPRWTAAPRRGCKLRGARPDHMVCWASRARCAGGGARGPRWPLVGGASVEDLQGLPAALMPLAFRLRGRQELRTWPDRLAAQRRRSLNPSRLPPPQGTRSAPRCAYLSFAAGAQ